MDDAPTPAGRSVRTSASGTFRKSELSLEKAGWVTAILFPLVGIVIGIILTRRGTRSGVQVILLSLAMAMLTGILLHQRSA
ncbi:hypothetical protein FHP29_03100 [Nocardioides albidus]|uniref:Uncharacterized protein n=1 Tax=Nocardioides albidus TaxID=1517589 RepID=A0A5C4WG44_9ACTN|nr:hypothetical protein [Nocardioides albidus]TNM47174.1 hypothetical protein FHP29_03100 [Nocardioides albidus]